MHHALHAFSCRDLGENIAVLRIDPRINCHSTSYSVLLLAAVVMAVLFVFGLPFFWLVTLVRHREDCLKTGEDGQPSLAAQQYAFLIGSYRPKYYLWEVAEMWRKVPSLKYNVMTLCPCVRVCVRE